MQIGLKLDKAHEMTGSVASILGDNTLFYIIGQDVEHWNDSTMVQVIVEEEQLCLKSESGWGAIVPIEKDIETNEKFYKIAGMVYSAVKFMYSMEYGRFLFLEPRDLSDDEKEFVSKLIEYLEEEIEVWNES